MPTLTLTFKDNTIATYRIEAGQSITIGRKASNNVPIENLAVSGHHAKIDSVGEGFLLTDLQSKNGSFVNKELVSSHWLKEGDNILIGKHTLIFTYDEGEKKPDELGGDMDQTMVMDTDKYRDMLAQAIPKAAKAEAKEPVGMLSYLAGGEGEIKLAKKLTKIGKSSTSDIVVGGLMMGATAATISKRPQGYSLSYVGGMTKPKVNGATVKESVTLKDFDEIELGSVKLQFYTEK
ncbi:MAG: FHA domain-containing protein [Desulfobacterales bacterium]|uniref:FHA domain-containing protein n=1 Tax=Candidatus Desulfatibia vada TaxID=2841696 RepID=A0A8J6TSX9_9BACT|nr:FHA domain-containing protein [Candidatus Desulfatibia vada]MBL6970678.1 FHA domain-containing protein [Desulfobacterales bacterium]